MKTLAMILLCGTIMTSCLCCDIITLMSMEPLEAGTEAPDFTLDSIDGTPISLSDYRGQVVLINFWTPT